MMLVRVATTLLSFTMDDSKSSRRRWRKKALETSSTLFSETIELVDRFVFHLFRQDHAVDNLNRTGLELVVAAWT